MDACHQAMVPLSAACGQVQSTATGAFGILHYRITFLARWGSQL